MHQSKPHLKSRTAPDLTFPRCTPWIHAVSRLRPSLVVGDGRCGLPSTRLIPLDRGASGTKGRTLWTLVCPTYIVVSCAFGPWLHTAEIEEYLDWCGLGSSTSPVSWFLSPSPVSSGQLTPSPLPIYPILFHPPRRRSVCYVPRMNTVPIERVELDAGWSM